MADMTAPAPGQFDAQAPGATAASGTASERLEGDLQSLEQQLAELQVRHECTGLPFLQSTGRGISCICSFFQRVLATAWQRLVLQVQVQRKRAEADSVAPYSKSFNRTLVGTLFSASGGLGLVWVLLSYLVHP